MSEVEGGTDSAGLPHIQQRNHNEENLKEVDAGGVTHKTEEEAVLARFSDHNELVNMGNSDKTPVEIPFTPPGIRSVDAPGLVGDKAAFDLEAGKTEVGTTRKWKFSLWKCLCPFHVAETFSHGEHEHEDSEWNRQPFWPPKLIYFGEEEVDPATRLPDFVRNDFHRAYLVLGDPSSCKAAMYFTFFSFTLIIVSLFTYVLETLPSLRQWPDDCFKPINGVKTAVCVPAELGNTTAEAARELHYEFCEANECELESHVAFFALEFLCVGFFTLEYLFKLALCWTEPDRYEKKEAELVGESEGSYQHSEFKYLKRVLRFLTDPLNLIDVAAIAPFYVSLTADGVESVTFLRILRLTRIVRILRVTNVPGISESVEKGMVMIMDAIVKSSLSLVVLLIYTMFIMVLIGAIVFNFEQGNMDYRTGRYMVPDNNPNSERESPFTSIPHCFWWTLVTFTTVGYGDLYPTTNAGRFVGVVAMYMGISLLAMPIAIIGGNYTELYSEMQREVDEAKRIRAEALAVFKKYLSVRFEMEEAEEKQEVELRRRMTLVALAAEESGKHVLQVGDQVKITKQGSDRFGMIATVLDPSWGGRIKVEINETKDVKSYDPHNVEYMQLMQRKSGSYSIAKSKGAQSRTKYDVRVMVRFKQWRHFTDIESSKDSVTMRKITDVVQLAMASEMTELQQLHTDVRELKEQINAIYRMLNKELTPALSMGDVSVTES